MSNAHDIAASIDTSTVAGHNLRALLLRLLDGDIWQGEGSESTWSRLHASFASLVEHDGDATDLTPLGREVAELLTEHHERETKTYKTENP